ncbi:tRNA1(Val) (adenine(37)-N6)-methyltransferase [Methylobacterium sp. J-068]|uniref:tRNA1(Val) (adenine(37)-N6)-methyltransferase n=1 Tax=Methylobacterium sp. J-068 TaxID=2836649 RepID=UPI001FB88656|nr:methyltransferase [Methylobacterium sp. J-068]MCJ2035124.1 methyltransferase [Methylobacterium sp. J-068]
MAPDAEPKLWLGGALRLFQPGRGAHRAGTDAVLLGSLLAPPDDAVICDIGASTGAVGLAVARRAPGARVILVERDPDLAACARRNADLNGLGSRTLVLTADVLAPGAARRDAGLVPNLADIVLTNPPFFEERRYRASPIAGKARAHGFVEGGLEAWLRTCVDILRPGGRIGLIHRADALPACLDALAGRFGGISVRPVHAKADAAAIRVLITAVKGSRAPLNLLPALVLHDATGRFTPHVQALNAGRAWIGES